MYRLKVAYFAGGECRVTTSLLCGKSPVGDEGSDPPTPSPPSPPPPLLDYSSELDKSVRARVSGHGELPVRVTKFGNEAKRSIQRCARALDGIVETPNDILFLTGTLPGTGQEQYLAMAQWSSYIVHALKNWIGNYVPAKMDFYCWELQKRGALHLHYAVHCPDEAASQYIMDNFKAQWCRLLDAVSLKSGVDLYLNQVRGFSHKDAKDAVQAKAERVTKGVGNYLGKYLSKSTQGSNPWGVFAPCRWWGVSRALRALEKSERWEKVMFFTRTSQWHGIYEDCVSWLGKVGDCMFEWKNQVMPGKGAVIYGVTKQTMLNLMEIATGRTMKNQTARAELAQAWAVLKEVFINTEMSQPMWFGSMTRKVRVMGQWGYIQNLSYDDLGSPNHISMLQSIASNVEDLLKSDEVINVEKLRYAWKASMLYGCKVLQSALDRIYLEEYKLNESEDFFTALLQENNPSGRV